MFTSQDECFMRRALELALLGQYTARPNPMVGAVLVNQAGEVIGEGSHLKAGEAHAEVQALRQAGELARGSTCYVTLEPCSHTGRTGPCVDALIQAGVSKIIFSMKDPNPLVKNNEGLEKLKKAGVEIFWGLLEQESRDLNPGFISRMERSTPYVRAKIAASLDGKTALKNGQSQWITSPESRQDVQTLRARSDVIISGSVTVKLDNPSLNIRLELNNTQPLRIICNTSGDLLNNFKNLNLYKTQEKNKVLNQPNFLIAHANLNYKNHEQGLYLPNYASKNNLENNQKIDLKNLLNFCHENNFSEVLIEAGSILTSAFLDQNLIDELWIYMAPCFLGSGARDMFNLPEILNLDQAQRWKIKSIQLIGPDLSVVLTRS